ncbi:oocyte zinc finger protein XlCOF22-like isoform X1 [Eleutherodactylus coqui]|uniref:oocyte zinc finger protein XlCOF22-like isoform X1 n=1 Tax=Eleutherodactylus coqui TaxID=57060 RepID=UPI003461F7A2
MDKERNEITEILLNFTLEIIYLLTGEDYTVVKKTSGDSVTPIIYLQESGGWSRTSGPITEPPPYPQTNKEKILELTKKMTELLTGEVPIRCQDVTVYFSMEEWEYIGGHRNLYKDIVMEDHQQSASADGAGRRNPPERRPCLYPQDCPEEDPDVPENQQSLRPPLCCTELLHMMNQGEDLTDIKAEVEGKRMTSDQLHVSEVEESPIDVTAEKHLEGNFTLSANYKGEDEDILQLSSRENLFTLDVPPGLLSTELSYNPPNQEEPFPDCSRTLAPNTVLEGGERFQCFKQYRNSSGFAYRRIHPMERPYSCSECGKCFSNKSSLLIHVRIHTGEKPYSCSLCGKCFTDKSSLVIHERIHKGEKPFSCSLCGKCFTDRSSLVRHKRIHTGEKPYSCSDCGKRFTNKSHLVKHERIHTGEKPYSCSRCRRCFTDKSHLVKHERSHTGEKPFSCSLCGKYFTDKSSLVRHEKSHTGEKQYPCSLCGKCFAQKSNLVTHERSHTGEKPYSCSECGKCFINKSNLVTHERSHTGEKPYSCSECGKCFTDKSNLVTHKRIHTGEKPYSCLECGKCFITKARLRGHQRIHTGEKPFSCSECGKCFTNKSNLVKHERSHTGEKPFPCIECGKCFITKARLGDHQRSHTGELFC